MVNTVINNSEYNSKEYLTPIQSNLINKLRNFGPTTLKKHHHLVE